MTFEEFAGTYGGFEIVPWLELLDLRNGPTLIKTPVSPSMEPKSEEIEESDDEDSSNKCIHANAEQDPAIPFGPRELKFIRDVENCLILDLTTWTCHAIRSKKHSKMLLRKAKL